MNACLAHYIAEKLVEDIRKGIIPSSEICESFSHFPIIDIARSLITENDWNSIKVLLAQEHEDQRTLGRALLNRLLKHPEVRSFLEGQWRDANLTFRDRIGIQFTLLNIEDLDILLHKEMKDFVFKNWEEWLKEATARWAGGRDKVLDYCSQRLSNPKTVKTKYWVYICGTAASDDCDAARKLIGSFRTGADRFLIKVIDQVLARL
ncbi:MAG: hypothetical protein IMZ61_08225 [Planctomycetes bacterium]|nr:hypothetical protein [Planctomycetota bacterium]